MLERLVFEKKLLKEGYKYIAGVDEVGRGPLAGPLVAAAVILDIERILSLLISSDKEPGFYTQINDSKTLTDRKRRRLDQFIHNEAISYSVAQIAHEKVDSWGIVKSTQAAFFQSINKLSLKPDFILTDAFVIKKYPPKNQLNLVKGDLRSISIAAASIVAKVFRDDLMQDFHREYPMYDFENNKGYGTRNHLTALKAYGPCAIHRRSFNPVKTMILLQRHAKEPN